MTTQPVSVRLVFLLSFFLFFLTSVKQSYAATFVVNTITDTSDASSGDGVCADTFSSCSLRAAIEESNGLSGQDNIILPAGEYTLSLGQELFVSSDLTVYGEGAGATFVQSDELAQTATHRVLRIQSGASVQLKELTIRNGVCAGACTQITVYGGGIFNSGSLNLDHVTVSDNIATSYASLGGGIFNEGSLLIQNDSQIGGVGHGNIGSGGGGGIYSSSSVTIDHSRVSANSTGNLYAGGGAIWNDGGTLIVQNGSVLGGPGAGNVVNNVAGGGAIFNSSGGSTTIDASILSYNSADYLGGAIHNGGTLIIRNGSMIGPGNSAANGGAITNYVSTYIDASTIDGNTSFGAANEGFGGGAVYNAGQLDIVNGSVIGGLSTGNSANRGGAIFNWEGNTVTIQNSKILSNSAVAEGGAVFNRAGGIVNISSSCIVGNSATSLVQNGSDVMQSVGNWWGAANGPSGSASGNGDSVSQNWNYANYLTAAPEGCPTIYEVTPTPTPTPTSTPTPTPTPLPQTVIVPISADSYVRSGNDNRNYGAGDFMRIQSSGNNRALLKADQDSLLSAVQGQVLSARLRLIITDNANNWGTTGRTVDLHRLTKNWDEGNGTEAQRGFEQGVTWNCATDSLIENQVKNCAGITEWEMGSPNLPQLHPWEQTPSGTVTLHNNELGTIEYDVTNDVTQFVNQTSENYGWLVKKTDEGQPGQASFGTRESTSQPMLEVTFQP